MTIESDPSTESRKNLISRRATSIAYQVELRDSAERTSQLMKKTTFLAIASSGITAMSIGGLLADTSPESIGVTIFSGVVSLSCFYTHGKVKSLFERTTNLIGENQTRIENLTILIDSLKSLSDPGRSDD